MGYHRTPSSNLYPEELQIKLYQAFIFSIPTLFSIILFLLFYLFYVKRRASTVSPPILPTTTLIHQATALSPTSKEMGLKGNLINKLPIIQFDEDLRTRDSLCCVCLGEFEIKEEVHQLPLCRHVFHMDCISYWLGSNATCPLCRASIVATGTKSCGDSDPPPPVGPPNPALPLPGLHNQNSQLPPPPPPPPPPPNEAALTHLPIPNQSLDVHQIQESSTANTSTTCTQNQMPFPNQDSLV